MLKKKYARKFLKRKFDQDKHLQSAIKGHHQRFFLHPSTEVKRLRRAHRWFLGAFNGHARALWFRSVAARLCKHLGARPKDWIPYQPVYFLTLIDADLARHGSDSGLREDLREASAGKTSISRAVKRFSSVLGDLNCFGMIDVSCYVSSGTVLGQQETHTYLPHFHGIVWGISEEDLERKCGCIRKNMKTFFKYATSGHFKLVKPGDLLQVIWYMCKTPRKQYQLWKRMDERIRQYKRAINGVNAVRLYSETRNVTLDQLTVVTGEGTKLLAAVMKELRRAKASAERSGTLPDPDWYQNRRPEVMPMLQIITLDELINDVIDRGFSVGDETIVEGIRISPSDFLGPEILSRWGVTFPDRMRPTPFHVLEAHGVYPTNSADRGIDS
jgi:hypothetical protein